MRLSIQSQPDGISERRTPRLLLMSEKHLRIDVGVMTCVVMGIYRSFRKAREAKAN